MIDLKYLQQYDFLREYKLVANQFDTISISSTDVPNTLSYFLDERYIQQINDNACITGVITTEALVSKLRGDLTVFVCEDPRYAFFTIYNAYMKSNVKSFETQIHPTAVIGKLASIAPNNVIIGAHTVIDDFVSVKENVEIGAFCVIKSGAVIGTDGFEFKKTNANILPVFHDGKVILEDYVHVGANTCIDKGIYNRNTVVRKNVKIDNLVYVAHNVEIGENTFVMANAMIGGSTVIGKNCWIAPSVCLRDRLVIGDNVTIGLAALVTKNVPSNEIWVGSPAKKFMKDEKA